MRRIYESIEEHEIDMLMALSSQENQGQEFQVIFTGVRYTQACTSYILLLDVNSIDVQLKLRPACSELGSILLSGFSLLSDLCCV